jgi:hypothetical protein
LDVLKQLYAFRVKKKEKELPSMESQATSASAEAVPPNYQTTVDNVVKIIAAMVGAPTTATVENTTEQVALSVHDIAADIAEAAALGALAPGKLGATAPAVQALAEQVEGLAGTVEQLASNAKGVASAGESAIAPTKADLPVEPVNFTVTPAVKLIKQPWYARPATEPAKPKPATSQATQVAGAK